MVETHVVSALVSKYAELSGLIDHHQQEIARLGGEIRHLSATIKLFSPEYDLRSAPKRVHRASGQASRFRPGECYRLCLDGLRSLGGRGYSSAIARQIMASKGFGEDESKAVTDSVNNSLKTAEANGLVRRNGKDGVNVVWVLA